MTDFRIRTGTAADTAAANYVCLKTGDHGGDGEPHYREDPDALGRIFVEPYLAFEPELSLILEDADGVCGYALAALDSREFYARYDKESRPRLCAEFPEPDGDPAQWTRVQQIHYLYHHPVYFYPDEYDAHPSHLHIDLLRRAQGRGNGRRLMTQLFAALAERGSPGVHLGVSTRNVRAQGFYRRLGLRELTRMGSEGDGAVCLGLALSH